MKPIVQPFVQVGPIAFGMTREQVFALLGEPSEKQIQDWGDGDKTECWAYPVLGIQIDFDSAEDWRASSFSLSQGSICGVEPIGMSPDLAIAAFLTEAGQTFSLSDDFLEAELRVYGCDEIGVTLWVEEGLIYGMDVFPKYDEEGNSIVWPKIQEG